MAGQPFDYRLNVIDPFSAATQGLQLGATMEQMQRQREDRARALAAEERARQQQAAMQERVMAFIDRPTAQGALALSALMPPDQAKSIREGWEMLDKDTQRGRLEVAGQALTALKMGKSDIAINLFRQYGEAARNSGDEDTARAYDTYADLAESSPEGVMANISGMIAPLPGGNEMLSTVFSEAKLPGEVREGEAKATTAEAESKAAGRTYEAAIKKAEADAKESEARIRKIDAEIKRLEQTGGLDPDKAFDMETKLRAEYFKNSAVFKDVRDAYQRVESSQDNAVGDLSLIFGYMKMLDPGSVVREGEFANASNAAGVDDRVRNLYNRLISGERLTAGQRASFKGQAKTLFRTAKASDDKVRSGLSRLAGSYGLRPENIFIESNEAVVPGSGQQRTISVDY